MWVWVGAVNWNDLIEKILELYRITGIWLRKHTWVC